MLRSPLFDIADVLRHRVCGAIGNVCHNSRGDLDVIRCALGDQAGLVPRPSVKILEVEAEIVQSRKRFVGAWRCRLSRQLLVKAGVENVESNGIILNRLMREELRYSAGGRLLRLTRRVREVWKLRAA